MSGQSFLDGGGHVGIGMDRIHEVHGGLGRDEIKQSTADAFEAFTERLPSVRGDEDQLGIGRQLHDLGVGSGFYHLSRQQQRVDAGIAGDEDRFG